MKLLTIDDTQALFDFEGRNKAWFEAWAPPRPATYFDAQKFPDVLAALIQGMSTSSYLLFVHYQGDKIIGRFNLVDIDGEQAEIGYRVCQDHLRRSVAYEGGGNLMAFALKELQLKRLVARAASDNIASQKVLLRHAFTKHPTFEERIERDEQVIILNQFLIDL